jgi:hypothetical protein
MLYEPDLENDDSLEKPTAVFVADQTGEEDEQSSDEEDSGLDWTKL